MRDRNWRMPAGMLRPLRQHRTDLSNSWHPDGRWLRVIDDAAGSQAVHVVSVGDGPDVLLLHGFVQSSWCWRHNVASLARRFRVHAPCALGAGWSNKPVDAHYDVASRATRALALMDAIGIERAHLVGNSLGAAVALQLAAKEPTRVGRLTLVNPAVAGRYPLALVARVIHPRLRPLFAAPGVSAGLWLGLRVAAYHGADVDAAYMRHFLSPLAAPGGVDAALAVARSFTHDMRQQRDLVRRVAQRCLTVLGGRDQIVPLAASERLVTELAQNVTVIYPDSAHCPHEEAPRRFNDDICAFFEAT